MSRGALVAGIDQGTSGSRALVLDGDGEVRGYGYRPLPRVHPRPEWVEQDPDAVADGVREALGEALRQAGARPADLAACGISCQRDTDFVWDARTGRPLSNAISWQDLRTQDLEAEVSASPFARTVRGRTGYWPGPYSAALHLAWRMRHEPAVAGAAREGRLRVGLSAAWLVAALGRPSEHAMDRSLCSATCLYDLRAGDWWDAWLAWVGVEREALPRPVGTVHDFGTLGLDGAEVPVLAMIGDQQAALFGADCRAAGDAECTHGTASYLQVNLGGAPPAASEVKLCLAWSLGGAPTYALEADTTVTGSVVRWMRERLRLFDEDADLGRLAEGVPDAGGVVFVPALTGLNVPYHVRAARGTLLGLTLGHDRGHVARAFLDGVAFQLRAILDVVRADAGVDVHELVVGGGLSASDAACAIQADWLGLPIVRPRMPEASARGAALLAGMGAGLWEDAAALPPRPSGDEVFEPRIGDGEREDGYGRWQHAIRTVEAWAREEAA